MLFEENIKELKKKYEKNRSPIITVSAVVIATQC